jgi:serine/threonine-protein kinase SRK2
MQVAIKFWPREREYINKDLMRELHNHSRFRHPNIIQFREVILTPTHVGLVMEYASGGDLFKRVKKANGLSVSPHPRGCDLSKNRIATQICN